MTEQEMQIAVCESLGWKRGKKSEGSFVDPMKTVESDCWLSPNGFPVRRLPDLTLDLMHEAEKTITDPTVHGNYRALLDEIATGPGAAVCATKHQRAEAYLRVKQLWKY